MTHRYRAIISSDWNECLAPCGPFDAIAFTYPALETELTSVFRRYTGNEIPLGEAAARIESILPESLTESQVDAYLNRRFRTYRGVSALIRWADRHNVLFMINTTGMIGYFQRIFARNMLPAVPLLAAHPLIRFAAAPTDPETVFPLYETADKPVHTETVARRFSIPFSKVAVMGDSGGDGPHFAWAGEHGAIRIGSMTKSSLASFCQQEKIDISLRFGYCYGPGEKRNEDAEMRFDFQDLIPFFTDTLLKG
jgi:hypothetical protein